MRSSDWLLLIGVTFLFGASAVLSAAETAFGRISRTRATALQDEGRRGAARLVKLLEHPERTLNTALLLVLICQLTAATLVGVLAERFLGPLGVALGIAIEVVVFFALAVVAPKTYAVQNPEAAALHLSGLLSLITRVPPLRVVIWGLIGIANVVIPGKGLKKGPFVSEEEIRTMADVAADEETIEGEERTLIHSIFEFGDTVVREVMVPRPDMVVVEAEATVDQALALAIEAGFSRLPVLGDGADDVVGLVYLKDLTQRGRKGDSEIPASLVARNAVYVPEQKRVAELLREMQSKKFHMAIVIDEHGGVAGLVTLEDLLEEIVGEIVDEYDVEEPRVERLENGTLRVAGRTSVDEVNKLLGVDLPATEWDTVAGLMFNLLGHVPVEGETVAYEDIIELRAERVLRQRIVSVRIDPLRPEPASVRGR